eukprot:1275215-Pleurochrysis_carterae.AAC.2
MLPDMLYTTRVTVIGGALGVCVPRVLVSPRNPGMPVASDLSDMLLEHSQLRIGDSSGKQWSEQWLPR